MNQIQKLIHRFQKVSLSHSPKEAFLDVMGRAHRKMSFKKRYYRMSEEFPYPICMRFDSTDYEVFDQVFRRKEYGCMDVVTEPKLIIDAGANIGLTSLYFLNKFPSAHIICVEPDSKNFDILRRNVSLYKDRTILVKSGVWSKDVGLKVKPSAGESSIQVCEASDNEEAELQAVTIDTLLKDSSFDQIDILKVDIEFAEMEVFGKNYESWLPKVRNIAIELHDEKCKEVFFKALTNYRYDIETSGELTVIKNLRPITS